MEYRQLRPDEFVKLVPAYQEFERPVPQPSNYSMVIGAFNGEELAGFIVFQPIYHSEPIWVKKEYRGKVHLPRFQREIEKKLAKGSEYFAFAPTKKIKRLVEDCGFEKLDWEVWRRKV